MRMKRVGVLDLLEQKKTVKICAPMVRYSKLQFRHLVRKWGADIAFTPMITADSFSKSAKAREADFSTDSGDFPLIVQFGASSPSVLLDAAVHVVRWNEVSVLVLNESRQSLRADFWRWAIGEKIGGYLLSRPDLIQDMIIQLWNRIPNPDFTKSIKIRVHEDIQKTVSLCRQLEAAGVSFITVHGRTLKQKSEPADWQAIKTIKDSIHIPVFANGDIKLPADIVRVEEETGVDGVMAANGLLMNPALFSGYDITPMDCIKDWLDINRKDTTCPFRVFHHHLIWMTEKHMSKQEKIKFSELLTKEHVVSYIEDYFDLRTETNELEED